LASGSSGNSVYIQSATTTLLLDVGISARQLEQRLRAVTDKTLADIDAIVLTHEHIDHVRGLKQAIKRSSAKVYATEGTWEQVKREVDESFDKRYRVVADCPFTIGDITITPFAVSHDAEEPVAYRFDCGEDSLAVVTDLGYVSDHIKQVIQNCKAYVWEANHDVDMLRAGRYPWSVKRRILGDKGHLSNYDSAVALADVLGDDDYREVYLAHLSEENNQPDLAELTVSSVLREIKAVYEEQVRLHRTARTAATALHLL
jgi:phosphoribosyl 1,2-cyclic phosphodiesterase